MAQQQAPRSPKVTKQNLRKDFESAVTSFSEVSANIEKRLALLEEKEKCWNELKADMKAEAAKAKTKITLNVGGKKFATAKSTLTENKGTYFAAMLCSGHWQEDEDKEYFIDRDPKMFRVILNYLRTGELDTTGWSERDLKLLKDDLEYYLIDVRPKECQIIGPCQTLYWLREFTGSNFQYSKKTIRKIRGPDGWNAAALGSIPNLPSFKFKVITVSAMVGLAPKKNFNSEGPNFSSCGWYLATHNGGLYSQDGDSGRSYAHSKGTAVIEVIYSRRNKTISFSIDGVSRGIAFRNVVADELYPAVCVYDHEAFIEILLK